MVQVLLRAFISTLHAHFVMPDWQNFSLIAAKRGCPLCRALITGCRCRELTRGWEALDVFEKLETKREGIFVLPKDGPIVIQSTYVYTPRADGSCNGQLAALQERFDALEKELHELRVSQLP